MTNENLSGALDGAPYLFAHYPSYNVLCRHHVAGLWCGGVVDERLDDRGGVGAAVDAGV